MLFKRIFRFFPVFLFMICCQKTDHALKKSDPVVETINRHYNLSKDKSKDSIQRLHHINRAYQLADKLQIDTLMLKTLDIKTQLHNKNEQPDSAIYFSYKMLRLSEKLQDVSSIGQSYFKLGRYYSEKNEIDSSYQYYNRAEAIFTSINDNTWTGKTLLNMSIIGSDVGDYFYSDEMAVKALKYLKLPKDSTHIASVYNCLAVSSKKRKDYEEALSWYDSAMYITNNEKNKITYLNNIAVVYTKQEKYGKAISIYDSIIDNPLIENDLKTKARILDNLTYAEWLMVGHNTHDLENKLIEALDMRIEENDLQGQIASNTHLSEYFEKSDIRKSIQYADTMYSASTRLKSIDDRLEALEKLINLENDPEKIKNHFNLYTDLNDSIVEIRVGNRSKFARIMMEIEAEKAQDQLEIEQLSRQNTIYFFVVVLFLMTSVFIYYQIKAKHKREKLQKIYETEVRLAKKLHDEAANDIYNVMAMIQKSHHADKRILNKLHTVYAKVRDISHENNDIDFEENFETTLKDLVWNYKNNGVNIITRGLSTTDWNTTARSKRIAIYRALQELLVNMKKHSGATHVFVSFKNAKNKIVIHYSDNGTGYDLNHNNNPQNVENRIKAVNGTINFESEKNKGFKVKITV